MEWGFVLIGANQCIAPLPPTRAYVWDLTKPNVKCPPPLAPVVIWGFYIAKKVTINIPWVLTRQLSRVYSGAMVLCEFPLYSLIFAQRWMGVVLNPDRFLPWVGPGGKGSGVNPGIAANKPQTVVSCTCCRLVSHSQTATFPHPPEKKSSGLTTRD